MRHKQVILRGQGEFMMNQDYSENEETSEEEDDIQRNTTPVTSDSKRVILLLDVDCYEVQLWMNVLRPDLVGKNVPVVVINPDQIILSVNYAAKSLGVKRGKGRRALGEARLLCKEAGVELEEIVAGERYGKVDSFLPVEESDFILEALEDCPLRQRRVSRIKIERTCKDEFYIDVTNLVKQRIKAYRKRHKNSIYVPSLSETKALIEPKNHPNVKYRGSPTTIMEGRKKQISGQELSFRIQNVYRKNMEPYHKNELRLVHGAIIAKSLIDWIQDTTQFKYEVSVGVGHSKLLAKLACGRNKPKGITIITDVSLPRLSKSIPFQQLPGFAGKIGENILRLFGSQNKKIESIYELLGVANGDLDLVSVFEKINFKDPETSALDLFNKCQFHDPSLVISKVYADTINTSLSFKGSKDMNSFRGGIYNISKDIKNRIDYYKRKRRIPTELIVKAEMAKGGGNISRGDRCNKLLLGRENISADAIMDFILRYYEANNLNYLQISKVCLTAGSIIQKVYRCQSV